jgi:hypothetical protein
MKIRAKDCVSPLTEDINVDAHFDVRHLDALCNRCINTVTDCLNVRSLHFSDMQRGHLQQVFLAMRHVHRAIRELLRPNGSDPISVSVMPLARAQLETFYAICLVIEKPDSMALYLKDGWKKLYIRHLLMREECRGLPRVAGGLDTIAPQLEQLRIASGATEEERMTIEEEELNLTLPPGIQAQHIRQFPSPKEVIRAIADPDRRAMLVRLYPEYQFLCGFVHFSPSTQILSSLLDKRHPAASLFSSGQREETFQKEIAGQALWIDFLSIVEACAELLTVYRDNVELARVAIESWNALIEMSLLARAIWQIRAKRLLGVVN